VILLLAENAYPGLFASRAGARLRWLRGRREVYRLLEEEIAAHRAHPGGNDVLSLLIAARDDEDQALGDAELRDQLVTLLLAGHETTAAGLAWCFERLVRHSDALERLNREFESDDGDDYLDAVINETLRVRPLIDQVVRKLAAPVEISGHVLPAGTIVAASIIGVQRSEVFDDPDRFRPERFLDQSPPPYTLIPFGGGPHRCLGASFAIMEMKTVLRAVLARVALRAPSATPERSTRVRRFATVPANGARVIVTAKRAPADTDRLGLATHME
jgi:cytochrome P450